MTATLRIAQENHSVSISTTCWTKVPLCTEFPFRYCELITISNSPSWTYAHTTGRDKVGQMQQRKVNAAAA